VPHTIAGTAVLAAIASLAVAGPAVAAPAGAATSMASPCSSPPTSQVFRPWGDLNDYFLAHGGDFESTGGWRLNGGARLVGGSEPFNATGKAGKTSLSLPTGATAVSPPMCMTPDHPTLRFFQKAVQGRAASLRLEALVGKPSTQVIGLGAANGTTAWAPSPVLSSGVSNLPVDASGRVTLQFRFTADYGTWQVDDLFVDPRKSG
jgi:hypothetical protein